MSARTIAAQAARAHARYENACAVIPKKGYAACNVLRVTGGTTTFTEKQAALTGATPGPSSRTPPRPPRPATTQRRAALIAHGSVTRERVRLGRPAIGTGEPMPAALLFPFATG